MYNNSFINNLQLSWSAFELYETCPFKFYQKYALRKVEPAIIFGLYGSALHDLFRYMYSIEEFAQKPIYAKWESILQKEYKLDWKQTQYRNITQKQVDSIKFLGFRHIKHFFQIANSEKLLRPALFIEEKIKGIYKKHKLVIKLDLGINTKYGLTLLDWKSGESKTQDFYQLGLYAALKQKRIEEQIKAVGLVYLKKPEVCYREITPEFRKETSNYIGKIYNKMVVDTDFKPKANEYCKTCYIKDICSLFKKGI